MRQVELTAEKRTITGKQVKQLRNKGLVPATLYGHKREPENLQLDATILGKALQTGMSRLISLQIAEGKPVMVMSKEIQRNSLTRQILHVDFYEVVMTEKVTTTASLMMVGKSPAVAMLGGVLIHGLDKVEIECLPGDLLEHIEVDISSLKEIDDALHVKDLQVLSTIQILTDPEEMVVKVIQTRRTEEEEAEIAEKAAAEVEVISSRKKEEEE